MPKDEEKKWSKMLEILQNFAQPLQEPPPQSYYKDRLTLYIKSEKLIAKSIELQ